MSITITDLIMESNKTAREKGWWEDGERNIGELIALIHSEVSEVLKKGAFQGVIANVRVHLSVNSIDTTGQY